MRYRIVVRFEKTDEERYNRFVSQYNARCINHFDGTSSILFEFNKELEKRDLEKELDTSIIEFHKSPTS